MNRMMRWLGGVSGFTLTEVVTAGAVLGIVATGGALTYARYVKSSQEMDLRDVMSSLRKETESALSSPANLIRSLGHPENGDFFSCFGSSVTNASAKGVSIGRREAIAAGNKQIAGCRATDANKFYPFVLQAVSGSVLSGGASSAQGIRATSAGRVVTAKGQTCESPDLAATDSRCEIEVTTSFRAICPPVAAGQPPASECVTPSTAEFFFTIRQLQTGIFYSRNIRFPGFNNMINTDGSARDRADAVRVRALDFMRPDFFQCPAGQTFKGFDQNGKIQCGFQENPCARKGPEFANWIFQKMNADGTVECRKPLQNENCATADRPLRVLRGVLPDGTLDCVDPKISNQGCKEGEVLVRFDDKGNPECVKSVLGQVCPEDKFLVGYDAAGNPRCVDMKTPSGEIFKVKGRECGHNHDNCSYSSFKKPDAFVPKCPDDSIQLKLDYSGPHCCATCGWVGQWWCDYLVATCAPFTTAKWQ